MSAIPNRERLRVPDSLRNQLKSFQWRVWSTKILESLALAFAVVLVAYLTLFIIDRMLDTPRSLRWLIFLGALSIWTAVPYAFYRWVWQNRRLDQLARLLRIREPSIGDQLLSVIELADNDGEQARSRALCAAAMAQVADVAGRRDLSAAAPQSRAGMWSIVIAALLVVVGTLVMLAPEATFNAWQRLSAPWRETARYTFTTIRSLPREIVVPHGESVPLSITLNRDSRWQPSYARLKVPDHPDIEAAREQDNYRFRLPALTSDSNIQVQVGDYDQSILIQPKTRPEIVSAVASVTLPEYLQLPDVRRIDVRSGALSIVAGSRAQIQAKASRPLSKATINGRRATINDASFESPPMDVAADPVEIEMVWSDQYGLNGRAPFQLAIDPLIDEPPVVSSHELPRQAVLLVSEQLNFSVMASDDFGVQRVGLSWRTLDEQPSAAKRQGERLIVAGAPDKSTLSAPAVFSAQALGIPAQPIEVRVWCEDYKPGRERVVSPPHIFYVLTAEQHALWITEQLAKWQRQSLDIRDTELQLNTKNKSLRELTAQELEQTETRDALRKQAQAEANNGRKLTSLAKQGEALLRKAARNPEIGVGHLERWAEMLQILNNISANRMPSVADLLDEAAQQQSLAKNNSSKPAGPSAGQQRSQSNSPVGKPPEEVVPSKQAPLPSIADSESSMQPAQDQQAAGDGPKKKFSGSRLSLPNTTLSGGIKAAKSTEEAQAETPDDEPALDRALYEQDAILADFEKITDELNDLLANLEGSTFVKRLKAAAREQSQVATKLTGQLNNVFGKSAWLTDARRANNGLNSGLAVIAPPNAALPNLAPPNVVPANGALPKLVPPNFVLPDIVPPEIVPPNVVLPNAAQPNAALPNAALPNAALPNAALPNAALPNAVFPNMVFPNVVLPDGAGQQTESAPDQIPGQTELQALSEQERKGSTTVSNIMDDMQNLMQRRQSSNIQAIVDEMRELAVVDALRDVADDLPVQSGLSVAQVEFWADTLDRWAEDLVDPANGGQCPGSKSSDALPPSIILEVLRVLEGEMNLREATRLAEQARPGLDTATHQTEAQKLTATQLDLRDRVGKVVAGIEELPEGNQRFATEIALMQQVVLAMNDAHAALATSDTGGTAQAAETEAIELLLQCKRAGGSGGGGGGSSPGGGGTGTTQDAAIALLGAGLNQKEHRESRDVAQATGDTGRILPEEYRAGLDSYFQRLEASK